MALHDDKRIRTGRSIEWIVPALQESVSLWERYASGELAIRQDFTPPGLAYDILLYFGLLRRHAETPVEHEFVAKIQAMLADASSLFEPALQYFRDQDLARGLDDYLETFEEAVERESLTEDHDELNALALDVFLARDDTEMAFSELCQAAPEPQFVSDLAAIETGLGEFDLRMRRHLDAFLVIDDDVRRVRAGIEADRIPPARYWWWYAIEDFEQRLEDAAPGEIVNPSGERCRDPREVQGDLDFQAVLYAMGEMSKAERGPYERHLARCHWCRERVEGAREEETFEARPQAQVIDIRSFMGKPHAGERLAAAVRDGLTLELPDLARFTLEGLLALHSIAPSMGDQSLCDRVVDEIAFRLWVHPRPSSQPGWDVLSSALRDEPEGGGLRPGEPVAEDLSTEVEEEERTGRCVQAMKELARTTSLVSGAAARVAHHLSPQLGVFPILAARQSPVPTNERTGWLLRCRILPSERGEAVRISGAEVAQDFRVAAERVLALAKHLTWSPDNVRFELIDPPPFAVEGESAGLPFLVALYCHFHHIVVPPRVAFTGMIGPKHDGVLPVARLGDKARAAANAGVRYLFAPEENCTGPDASAAKASHVELVPVPSSTGIDAVLEQIESWLLVHFPACFRKADLAVLESLYARIEGMVCVKGKTNYEQERAMFLGLFKAAARGQRTSDFHANLAARCADGLHRVAIHSGSAGHPDARRWASETSRRLTRLQKQRRLDAKGCELLMEHKNNEAVEITDTYDYVRAEQCVLESIRLKEASSPAVSAYSYGRSLGSLGQLYTVWGLVDPNRFAMAEDALLQALDLVEVGDRDRELNYLRRLYTYWGRLEEAQKIHQRLARKPLPDNYDVLGAARLFYALGLRDSANADQAMARKRFRQALKWVSRGDPQHERTAWVMLLTQKFEGCALRELGTYDQARDALSQSAQGLVHLGCEGQRQPFECFALGAFLERAKLEVLVGDRGAVTDCLDSAREVLGRLRNSFSRHFRGARTKLRQAQRIGADAEQVLDTIIRIIQF